MKRIIVLAVVLGLSIGCYAYDVFLSVRLQRSDDIGVTWTTFGPDYTTLLSSTNAPQFFYGWANTSADAGPAGTRLVNMVVVQGSNTQTINTPFMTFSNFPVAGFSNSLYRPDLTIGKTNVTE